MAFQNRKVNTNPDVLSIGEDQFYLYPGGYMQLRQLIKQTLLSIGRRIQVDTLFYTKIMGWVGFNYVTNILRGVATTFLMARLLPTEIFGSFRYVIAIYGLAGVFSFSSYHMGIIRGIAANDTEVVWVGGKKMLKYSLIGSTIILAASAERFWKHEPIVSACLLASSFFFPFTGVGSLYGSILTGKNELKKLSYYNAISNLLFTLLFIITLLLGRKSLFFITLAFFGGDVLFKMILSAYQIYLLPRRGTPGTHMELGSHLSIMGIFQALAHQLDQLILQRFFGYTALANYNVAILIPDQIIDFVKSFSGIFLQRKTKNILQRPEQEDLRAVHKQIYLFLGAMFGLWILYALAAPTLILTLLPHYKSQILPTIIYSLGILGSVTGIGLSWMQARHHLRRLWIFSVVNTIFQTLGTIILTPRFGGMGAIIAKTVTRLGCIPFTVPRTKNKYKTRATSSN